MTDNATRVEIEGRRKLVSDIFHALNQPVTALHCSLELALRKQMTPAEYRAAIQSALESTERMMQTASFVRQMADADDPGETVAIDLAALLREALEEFWPVAESQSVNIDERIGCVLPVKADPARIRQCLFYLFDFLLQPSLPGSTLTVAATSTETSGFVSIATPVHGGCTAASRGLDLCARMLGAIGGSLQSASNDTGVSITIKIPLCRESIVSLPK